MGVEELTLIAEILGGLESAGLTGFLFWLGTKFIIAAAQVGLLFLVVWLGYKLCKRYLGNEKYKQHFKTLAAHLKVDLYGSPSDNEMDMLQTKAVELLEQRARFEEKQDALSLRLASLTKDYEKLYEAWADKKELVETQQKMLDELKERVADGKD